MQLYSEYTVSEPTRNHLAVLRLDVSHRHFRDHLLNALIKHDPGRDIVKGDSSDPRFKARISLEDLSGLAPTDAKYLQLVANASFTAGQKQFHRRLLQQTVSMPTRETFMAIYKPKDRDGKSCSKQAFASNMLAAARHSSSTSSSSLSSLSPSLPALQSPLVLYTTDAFRWKAISAAVKYMILKAKTEISTSSSSSSGHRVPVDALPVFVAHMIPGFHWDYARRYFLYSNPEHRPSLEDQMAAFSGLYIRTLTSGPPRPEDTSAEYSATVITCAIYASLCETLAFRTVKRTCIDGVLWSLMYTILTGAHCMPFSRPELRLEETGETYRLLLDTAMLLRSHLREPSVVSAPLSLTTAFRLGHNLARAHSDLVYTRKVCNPDRRWAPATSQRLTYSEFCALAEEHRHYHLLTRDVHVCLSDSDKWIYLIVEAPFDDTIAAVSSVLTTPGGLCYCAAPLVLQNTVTGSNYSKELARDCTLLAMTTIAWKVYQCRAAFHFCRPRQHATGGGVSTSHAVLREAGHSREWIRMSLVPMVMQMIMSRDATVCVHGVALLREWHHMEPNGDDDNSSGDGAVKRHSVLDALLSSPSLQTTAIIARIEQVKTVISEFSLDISGMHDILKSPADLFRPLLALHPQDQIVLSAPSLNSLHQWEMARVAAGALEKPSASAAGEKLDLWSRIVRIYQDATSSKYHGAVAELVALAEGFRCAGSSAPRPPKLRSVTDEPLNVYSALILQHQKGEAVQCPFLSDVQCEWYCNDKGRRAVMLAAFIQDSERRYFNHVPSPSDQIWLPPPSSSSSMTLPPLAGHDFEDCFAMVQFPIGYSSGESREYVYPLKADRFFVFAITDGSELAVGRRWLAFSQMFLRDSTCNFRVFPGAARILAAIRAPSLSVPRSQVPSLPPPPPPPPAVTPVPPQPILRRRKPEDGGGDSSDGDVGVAVAKRPYRSTAFTATSRTETTTSVTWSESSISSSSSAVGAAAAAAKCSGAPLLSSASLSSLLVQ